MTLDTDGDGEVDCRDNDDDNDGAKDANDNCPRTLGGNADQTDNDNDGAGVPCDPDDTVVDFDLDGCSDGAELGTTAQQGGLRDPQDIWDVYDTDTENGLNAGTALTGTVTVGDIFAVAGRFGATGDPGIDPLSDASGPDYHTRFDRGDQVGKNSWNRAPPDGAVAITDIFAVAAQFGLDCS